MSNMNKRFELKISLSFADSPTVLITHVAAELEDSLQRVLKDYPAITAYFVSPHEAEPEIEVGLRFEGMEAKFIQDTADEVLEQCMSSITRSGSSFEATREESTLIPA